jgi:LmbE family N-acetylglucosaminyl deacetylase
VKQAYFSSGLSKIKTFDKDTPQEAYRPAKLFYYMQTYTFEPSFIVDVSPYFKIKKKAMMAYATQFYDPNSTEPNTFISSPEFAEFIRAKAEFYGFKIGKKYGEPFFTEEELELDLVNYINKL